MKKREKPQIKNLRRRKSLRYLLLVGAGFLAGKFLDSIIGLFSSKKKSTLKGFESAQPQREETTLFKDFVVKETGKELSFFERKSGYKIFVIEK